MPSASAAASWWPPRSPPPPPPSAPSCGSWPRPCSPRPKVWPGRPWPRTSPDRSRQRGPMIANQLEPGAIVPPTGPRLRGRALRLARLAWIAVSLAAVGLMLLTLIANVVLWSRNSATACPDEACLLDYQAHIQVFGSMLGAGLSSGTGQAVEMLPWIVAGALIFWRKSEEPFALGFSLMLILAGVFISDAIVQVIITDHIPALLPLMTTLNFAASAMLVLFYRFPDGRFILSPMRWAAAPWVALVAGATYLPGTAF